MNKPNNLYLICHAGAETDPWNALEVQVSIKGELIRCSPIKEVRKQNDTLFVTTASGSIYELGEPEPTYAKMFLNAKERLFNIFNKTSDVKS